MKIIFVLFCLLSASPQKEEILVKNSFVNDLREKNCIIKLLPFCGKNTSLVIKVTTEGHNRIDTSYWGLDLHKFKFARIASFTNNDIIICNDTVNQIIGEEIISSYVIKKHVLNKICKEKRNEELSTNLRKKRFIRSKIDSQIKSTNIKQHYTFADDDENEISQIYLRNNGNAYVVVNTAGEFGLKQVLFLYNMKNESLTKINFSKSVYKIHDINELKLIAQYEVGGEFFITDVDDNGIVANSISILDKINGEYQALKFVSSDRVIGLDDSDKKNPIKLYHLRKIIK